MKNYGDTNFVTGMRAFAAFAVVLIHSGGAGIREFGEIGNSLVNLGASGVYAFFVISGFSVASSYSLSTGYFNYLNKRLWRLVPLYYFWITICILTSTTSVYWQERYNVSITAYNVFMHASFLSFLDYRITNSILGVEWSISIEIFWYLLIPLLLGFSKSNKQLIIMLVVSLFVYLISKQLFKLLPLPKSDINRAFEWSPIPYAFSYCIGIAVYRLREYSSPTGKNGNYVMGIVLILLALYVIRPPYVKHLFPNELIFISLITGALILYGSNKSALFRCAFENKVSLFLGLISYGVYLCRLPLLALIAQLGFAVTNMTAMFFILSITAILASTLTYFLLEQPGIALGRTMAKRMCR